MMHAPALHSMHAAVWHHNAGSRDEQSARAQAVTTGSWLTQVAARAGRCAS